MRPGAPALTADSYRKHIVIDKIFTENLLTKVKDEILEHLSFTEKETDIYKVLHFGENDERPLTQRSSNPRSIRLAIWLRSIIWMKLPSNCSHP